jgi:hypothetical protein
MEGGKVLKNLTSKGGKVSKKFSGRGPYVSKTDTDDRPLEPWNDPAILAGLRPRAIREEVQKTASDSLREIGFR